MAGLVTLGTPHVAAPPSARDMTGGALTWVNNLYPGVLLRDPHVMFYIVSLRNPYVLPYVTVEPSHAALAPTNR